MKRAAFLLSFAFLLSLTVHARETEETPGEAPEQTAAEGREEPAATPYEIRTWTDKSDRKVRARFIELKDGRVTIEREDGRRFDVPLENLGTADRTYLRNKRIEFFEKIKADKTEAEEAIAASGGIVTLHDKNATPIPAGFSKRFRSPLTAARSVAYSDDGARVLVWEHNNLANLWDNRTGRKLKEFKGNTSGAEVIAFSGNGRLNVSGSGNKVLLKDTLTGEVLKTLEGHGGFVTPVAMSDDGKLALSGSADKTAILWDVEAGTIKHRLEGHKGRVLSVAFHPKGKHVLTGDDRGTAIQWDIDSGSTSKTIDRIGSAVNSVSYNQDGSVAVLIAPSTAVLWDTFVDTRPSGGSSGGGRRVNPVIGERETLPLVVSGDRLVTDGTFDSVAFSRDNSYFLLVSKIGNVYFGNLKAQSWVRKVERLETGINRAGFNPDASEYLTVSFNDNAVFWQNETGEKIDEFKGFNYCVSPIRMTRDGTRILTSGGWTDPTIAVWDTRTGQLLKRLDAHKTAVRRIEILPNGKRLLSISFEQFDESRHRLDEEGRGADPRRHVILWDISTGEPLIEVEDAVAWALPPNGNQLITATCDRSDGNEADTISFWDTHTGRRQRQVELKSGNLGHDFRFYPDGTRLLAKRGNAAFNWVARSGKEAGSFRYLSYDVWLAEFSPDNKFLLKVEKDGHAVYWNLLKDAVEHDFGGHSGPVLCLAVSPDGKKALTGSTDRTAILWDTETGRQIKKLTAGDTSVVGVDFTSDSRLAMVASEDGTVTFHGL